ncbi:MAG: hypothetical protein ACK5P7_11115 [Bdellovibrio sp.]
MALKVTPVSQCLEKKLQVMGYEIPDLLFIFFLLSILNFLFGAMPGKLFFVWFPTLAVALTIRIGKRGKPDNYLLHLGKFWARPKALWAFPESKNFQDPPHFKRKGV